jgi:hypothetical protein
MNAEALLARHAAAWQAATVHPFLARVRDGTRGRTRRARSSARIWARSWSWPRWRHRHPESSPWIPAPWSGKCSQVLAGYHRAKRHGGADRVTSNALDGLLAAPTEQVFRRADRLPQDAEVLRTLEDAQPELLGEGYHVVTLCDPAHRLVVKDAKSTVTIPPLAPPAALSDRRACATDHGVGEDGRLHEAIWQHIRVFESYGQLTVPNRVYVAGDVFEQLDGDERRAPARLRELVGHSLCECLTSVLERRSTDEIYNRRLAVGGPATGPSWPTSAPVRARRDLHARSPGAGPLPPPGSAPATERRSPREPSRPDSLLTELAPPT